MPDPRDTDRVWPPLVELTLARMREFLRQPEAVFWVFAFPVLLATALGIAFRNSGPEKVPIGVEDGSPESAVVLAALNRSVDIDARLFSAEAAALALRTGRVVLVVKPTGKNTNVYRFDPTRPESRLARLAVDDALERNAGRTDVIRAGDEKVVETGSRYIDFLVPGLLGMNLMGSGLWGLGFAVVMARNRGLLKRLAATPMRRSHFLLSYMLSRLLFLFLEVAAVVGFARVLFGVSMRGSWLDLAFIALFGALTFAGVGMLVASRARTIEAVSGLMNLVMLPMWILSGTFFSAARFPEFAQPFIKALPLTALNDALRAVMNDGAGIAASWTSLAVLATWMVVSFVIALRIFRWQ